MTNEDRLKSELKTVTEELDALMTLYFDTDDKQEEEFEELERLQEVVKSADTLLSECEREQLLGGKR